mgnify:FL=1
MTINKSGINGPEINAGGIKTSSTDANNNKLWYEFFLIVINQI